MYTVNEVSSIGVKVQAKYKRSYSTQNRSELIVGNFSTTTLITLLSCVCWLAFSQLCSVTFAIINYIQVFGLPGLLCTISGSHTEDSPPIELYGPIGLRKMLRTTLNLARSQLQFQFKVNELHHDIHPGDYDGMVLSD